MRQFASRSPFVFFFIALLAAGVNAAALAAPKLQQFAVPADDGLELAVMQSLNSRGYSAFALDMRGYGKTPRDAVHHVRRRVRVEPVAALKTIVSLRGFEQDPFSGVGEQSSEG